MSSWNCACATLPIRTGRDPRYPASPVSSTSDSRRSPPKPYINCRSRALPAELQRSHSENARALAVNPTMNNAYSAKVASRIQVKR